ncbi:hypothetical protein PVT68_14135 [Microbulbifer bruguierae]|uniref:Transposase n=1 Tax=Microbulbifer bruguierae TaxID=3029061 RepID=A0ABY8NBV1_9GAMM|nr:hypothetical protein [Microbulbifer bruguierae]WGL15904.1 hypothetical protein PVT68_14135 [Microbulbifer bruguierae]
MFGQAQVKLAGKLWLLAGAYDRIHNVTLHTHDGATQVDHITSPS